MRADGAKQLEYDGNTFAQANINLSRAITTLFLVTDAYNLTMQYSNDNKKDANKSAKNRAAQEISRISVSAYIMAFVHNLLSKLCNSSLGGAFTLTALTSSINDSLSRKVVGVPLTAKTQEQLEAIDAKNSKSKSPIKKALAYSIGKKGLMPAATAITGSNQASNDEIDYFNNDFFITPEIN
ncbi:unknown [Clostridium sp. CAG:306]|nr:unknown [Clostridium sp. CAG:306]